jgi:non-ribosomal peptide synthase protein (TIGR01720 family)
MRDATADNQLKNRLAKLSPTQKQKLADKLSISMKTTDAKLVACVTVTNDQLIELPTLKRFAESRLPQHFIPQIWKQVQYLPRLPSGKIQRNNATNFAWAELEEPCDDTFDIFGDDSYVAPTNETEKTLSQIWSDVLGAGDISIHDEFLEVGGDSLLSIRILARINKAGLSITTEDFFTFPTIAGQAKAISNSGKNLYEQGTTKGIFDLIPIQHWLFERIQHDPQHWNQNVVLNTRKDLDFPSLERTVQKILSQHDVLRSVFRKEQNNQWKQEFLPLNTTQLPLAFVDLSNEDEDSQTNIIEQYSQELNHSMDLTTGPLIKIVYFQMYENQLNKLLIAVHHLIIDAESWRILLEDMQTCWTSFSDGKAPSLPNKTSSFKLWSEKLKTYAQSNVLIDEQAYWHRQTTSRHSNIPQDMKCRTDDNIAKTTQLVTQSVDPQTTTLLLKTLPKQHKIEARDVLICALICSINQWSNTAKILIDVEGHGREDIFSNVDISRTIGWFTSVFPVLFEFESTHDLATNLQNTQKIIKQIPNKGIGHGIIRELSQDSNLKQQRNSEICFNYLGQTTHPKSNDQPLQMVQHNIGQPRSPNGMRAYLIEVNARVHDDQLIVDWFYSDKIHFKSTIESLARIFNKTLVELVNLDQIQPTSFENDSVNSFDLDENELNSISNILSLLED